jgi:hypothetical protein
MPRISPVEGKQTALGAGLIGLIVAVAILGGLAAAVLVSRGSDTGARLGGALKPTQTPSASPGAAAPDIAAAANATCRADYQAVNTGVSYYQALNGHAPADIAALGSLLKDPVASPRFTITINPQHPGQVEVATPGHPASPGDGNCAYAS